MCNGAYNNCLDCPYPDCIADNSLPPIESFEIDCKVAKVCKSSEKTRQRKRKYWKLNKEKMSANYKKYAAEHAEELKKKRREYYLANREKCIAAAIAWRRNNPDKRKEIDKKSNENKKKRKKVKQAAELLRQMQPTV